MKRKKLPFEPLFKKTYDQVDYLSGFRYQGGRLLKAKEREYVTWPTERDLMYDHIKQMRPPLFNVTTNESSPGSMVLEILVQHVGLFDYVSQQTASDIASVNKYFWNISACPYEPAFPPNEDMPREIKSGFNVYYIVSNYGKVHRLTLTRYYSSKNHGKYGAHAAILNGEILYIVNLFLGVTVLFPHPEVKKVKLPRQSIQYHHPSFVLDKKEIDIHHHINYFFPRFSYFPKKFDVHINGHRTTNGKKSRKWKICLVFKVFWYIFLFFFHLATLPLYCAIQGGYIIFCRIFVYHYANKSMVKKYWLSSGSYKHVRIDESKLSVLKGHAMV